MIDGALVAVELDVALHGRRSGRLFYLDEDTFIAWRANGKVIAAPLTGTAEAAGQPQTADLAELA